MSTPHLSSVTRYGVLIQTHLRHLTNEKEATGVEPPISERDCAQLIEDIRSFQPSQSSKVESPATFAALETAFREKFLLLLSSTPITDPLFSQVWNLLDIVNVLSDRDLCEPGLGFWLIEELLDSQTIDGCRKVFDYLESRRERITAKHFKHKSLAILRCCNELLRRLSRAEDTVFCGRVFIFLFQSFPLGDKSSVNLRGEFHVENVTNFDPVPNKSEDAIKPMEIDSDATRQPPSGSETPLSLAADGDRPQTTGMNTPAERKQSRTEEPPDLDTLYPVFWSLQSIFSSPTRLFDSSTMISFKDGIAETLACFQKMNIASGAASRPDELKRGIKRKRSDNESGNSSTFNPKYLTNRDLFDLEVHDVAFRRHILVQALILIDFLLSLSPAAKAKLADLTNKSVLYSYTLSNDDAKWAAVTRSSIAEYLQQGAHNEGKFYYRMVDTVLSRDKNWVRWKAENCPSISRPSVEVKSHVEALQNLQKLSTKQSMPLPPGAADLDFLSKIESMESLKDPGRHQVPTMEEFYKGIVNDELDAEMGTSEEMAAANEAKQSKLWRALRASGRRFYLCEKIENGKNLKALLGKMDSKNDNDDGVGKSGGRNEENDENFGPTETQSPEEANTSEFMIDN